MEYRIKNLTSKEKAELMKNTIRHLYSNEGRSKSYISRLLEINRKTVSDKIAEWNLPEAEPRRHASPSTQKFINANRSLLKSRLDNDIPAIKIADELGVSRGFLQRTVIPADDVLRKAHEDYINRLHQNAKARVQNLMDNSSRLYEYEEIQNETWVEIMGYPGYEVSDKGRVRHYAKQYKQYYLLRQSVNSRSGRLYVMLHTGNKSKNLQVARIVAHTFVDGHSDERNTVNHKDGNILNNQADNLEWMSQSENNTHAYRTLHRITNSGSKPRKIIYQDKYEFGSVAAFARFLHKSETQTRRYMDSPGKYDIRLVG